MEDLTDRWWQQKIEEQKQTYGCEIEALRRSLSECKDAAIIIAAMKKKLVMPNGRYHNILKQYEKELNTIFNTLEDLAKE
jgi:DNA repair exonuclease SbcCD ATPase subunit